MHYCRQASVDTVARINLQPKEKVVWLLVRPNNLDNNARKCDLTNNDTIPNAVEQIEAGFFVNIAFFIPFVEIHLEKFEYVHLTNYQGKIAALSNDSCDEGVEIEAIKNMLRMQLFFINIF